MRTHDARASIIVVKKKKKKKKTKKNKKYHRRLIHNRKKKKTRILTLTLTRTPTGNPDLLASFSPNP